MTDSKNGQTFAMLNDNGTTQNVWVSTNSNMVTIPVGISAVGDAWLMLNNYWGTANEQDTDVYFTFGSTSNATSGLTMVEVELTNANSTVTGGNSGQMRSAVSCLSGNAGLNAYSTCENFAGGNILSSSNPTTLINGVPQPTGIQVLGDTIYSSGYTNTTATNFANTSGNVQLNDLGFQFGNAFDGLYLVSIGVQENFPNLSSGSLNANLSATALSAITIDTVPEPSTWSLLMGGIVAVGIGGFRRRQRRSAAKG
jgi:hypothetical protein